MKYILSSLALLYSAMSYSAPSIVDVSHYSGKINWQIAHQQGIKVAIVKATQGNHYTDPMFLQNTKQARKSGIKTIPYHVFSYHESGISQARYFASIIEKYYDNKSVEVAIDIDSTNPSNKDIKQLDIFIRQLEKLHFSKIVIYITSKTKEVFESLPSNLHLKVWQGYDKNESSLALKKTKYIQFSINQKVDWAQGPVDFNKTTH